MDIRIALAGNPNSGKTTMFNGLTGSSQYVGNWPGVTVEKKEGKLRGHKNVIVTDLPGIYSLSPYSPEELVSRDYLVKERPDAIINIVDATNLERNLYLTTQLIELGIPVVIALNMFDLLKKSGDTVNKAALEDLFGCTVIETSALKGQGIKEAAEAAIGLASQKNKLPKPVVFSKSVEAVLAGISESINPVLPANSGNLSRWYSIKVFERDANVLDALKIPETESKKIDGSIKALENEQDDDSESIITNERYTFISKTIKSVMHKKSPALSTSDKIDRIVTNRWLALPIFAVVMFLVYYISVTTLGALVTDFTNDTLFGDWIQGPVGEWLEGIGAAAWLTSLIVDGIIGGVGAVLGFVPQLFVLFFFLAFLEDCGYMARVAFIMDRIFRKFGLSGKSFIPMLISSGCGVPGVMAAKTIENEKDRRMTVMTTTFIPCSAKLPIIAFLAGIIAGGAGWVAPSMYFLGIFAVISSGIILKKTKMFAGEPAPFVMELPSYHWPSIKSVLFHMWDRVKAFIIKAGTIIFIACGIIWFLSSFGFSGGSFGMVEQDESLLAFLGNMFAWIFMPLGFGNWQATVATITGLVAKENVVATFGILTGVGEVAETDPALWAAGRSIFPTAIQGLSFLVFNLLCAPCFAAIGAIRREMASGKWTWFAIGYQTVYAYVMAFLVYQFGSLITGLASFSGWTVAAIVLALGFLYLLFRPDGGMRRRNSMQNHANA
ncbi:ferrous iron transport protein B [Brucepastera parasyntrophica]|uniref:ferrous iron transport protein B n=1 Tax=Brucepastera parasyntrophica TaxID=2880008 RepID=UPI00210DBF9C|nr:ferrous iron transport protein B [Brucepastera parasyntrophica]ULQ60746.1 ferrous iron transport protein B [Brucepastera parasyntrophica]